MKTMCIIIYRLNLPGRPVDEVFAKIDGFPRYLASNYGLIYDTYLNYVKSSHVSSISNSGKYYDITSVVNDSGKKVNGRINRLVLMAFRPLYDDYSKYDTHHINENTQDNRLCNLEWKTHLENCQEHYFYQYVSDNYIYTDEVIHKICYGIERSMPYDKIATDLIGIEYNNTIKAYISAIRAKKLRKDISDRYNFPTKMRNTAILSDEQIHKVCKYLAKGYTAKQIVTVMGMDNLNKERRTSVLNVIGKIKTKSRFTRISDLYF